MDPGSRSADGAPPDPMVELVIESSARSTKSLLDPISIWIEISSGSHLRPTTMATVTKGVPCRASCCRRTTNALRDDRELGSPPVLHTMVSASTPTPHSLRHPRTPSSSTSPTAGLHCTSLQRMLTIEAE